MMMKFLIVVVVLGFLGSALAGPVPEVPSVNVTLSGGPEKGRVKEGQNFVLNCTFTVRYPRNYSNRWKTTTTFYLDGDALGEYRSKCFLDFVKLLDGIYYVMC